MRHHTFLGGCVLLLAAAAGCYTGGSVDAAGGPSRGSTTDVSATTGAGDATATGVPCDVADVLLKRCAQCHGAPLSGGAPNRMLTYEDLTAASRTDATRSLAELSIERMRDPKSPMPPAGAAEGDIAIFEAWVAAGTPPGSCASPLADPSSSGAYDTPTVCTSDTEWTRGDHESPLMHPGVACIECHDRKGEGPIYSAAGTLYPTAHEPDDCNGSTGSSVKVVITDANGKTYTLPVNAAGNFFLRTRFASPYRAKVVAGTKTREMATPQTDGDCNTCHSEQGTEKAPGRVMAP